MIKELKINFYRLVRSTSFRVIVILLLLASIISCFEIKILVDNTSGIFSDMMSALITASDDEIQAEDGVEEGGYGINVSLTKVSQALKSSNSLSGVLHMQFYEGGVFLLMAIMAALFVGAEYKSRFHVNRFSVNASPTSIVLGEVFSLYIVGIALELLCYLVAVGLTYMICDSFVVGSFGTVLKDWSLVALVTVVYITIAYAVAYIRRASAMAIAICSLLATGILDLILLVFSRLIKPLEYFALSSTMSEMVYNRVSTSKLIWTYFACFVYLAISLSVILVVASKRDAY